MAPVTPDVCRGAGPSNLADPNTQSMRYTVMATDYDAPRVTESDETDTSLEQLTASRKDTQSPVVDVEDTDTAESFELPGADLSGEEFTVRVIPKQSDEFTCTSCFLVHHRSRLAEHQQLICRDCA